MFLLFLPGVYFALMILMAVLPALLLMRFVYRLDSYEKESSRLLLRLILLGVLAGFLSMILESVGMKLLSLTSVDPQSPRYIILMAFLVVALVEEGMKYLLMHIKVWKSPEFDFRFDGIVYAVFVSLGFAAMENIMYVLGYGMQVVFARALMAIPAHMSFAVVFGVFYGRARQLANAGHMLTARLHILAGFALAVFFHGFYDTCAMLANPISLLLLALFMVVIYVTIFMLVKSEARTDRPII